MSEEEVAQLMRRMAALEARMDRHLDQHTGLHAKIEGMDEKLDAVGAQQVEMKVAMGAVRSQVDTLKWVLGGGFSGVILAILGLIVTIFLAAIGRI